MSSSTTQHLTKEFNTLRYVLDRAQRILLVAHTRPDPDAVGSVTAMTHYIRAIGKHADIACYSPFPDFLSGVLAAQFHHPDTLDLSSYDVIIGCDSVDRGFDTMIAKANERCVTVAIDHHPDIETPVDVRIIDPSFAATCELIYHFLTFINAPITRDIATALLVGIIGDTGSFKHANTSARVISAAAHLMQRGAEATKIINNAFANKKISTLHLWGTALAKSRLDEKTGMIATALTRKDLSRLNPSSEDIKEVASILSTVPGARFSLIIFQIDDQMIKGSLRAEKEAGVDVSAIAHRFGGGGHTLASGFEIRGKIVETENGWQVV